MKAMDVETIRKEWPKVSLIRGIRLTYKGKSMYFPKVYIGPSEMDDYDRARASIDVQEANDDQKDITAQRKAMTLCSRVILSEGYRDDKKEIKTQLEYALRERDRKKIEHKITNTDDEAIISRFTKELEELPSLPEPTYLFVGDDTILSFGVSNMSGEGTLPVDNGRLTQAYQKINYFQNEEVEDFLVFPDN